MRNFIISLINFYSLYLSFDRGIFKVLAPGGSCKYSPSCSVYTKQMVEKYGVSKGLKLGFWRILSCR